MTIRKRHKSSCATPYHKLWPTTRNTPAVKKRPWNATEEHAAAQILLRWKRIESLRNTHTHTSCDPRSSFDLRHSCFVEVNPFVCEQAREMFATRISSSIATLVLGVSWFFRRTPVLFLTGFLCAIERILLLGSPTCECAYLYWSKHKQKSSRKSWIKKRKISVDTLAKDAPKVAKMAFLTAFGRRIRARSSYLRILLR